MSDAALTKVTAKSAEEVCRLVPLSDPAKALLQDSLSPGAYLKALVDKGILTDALRVLAFALPKREAVGWAWQCVRDACGPNPEPAASAALQAAHKWVAEPNDDNSRLARPASEAAGMGTPAGLCAAAAFWSGSSLGPPDQKPIPPDETLTAKGVGGAILLAGLQGDAAQAMTRFRRFFDLGLEVARGATPWKN